MYRVVNDDDVVVQFPSTEQRLRQLGIVGRRQSDRRPQTPPAACCDYAFATRGSENKKQWKIQLTYFDRFDEMIIIQRNK